MKIQTAPNHPNRKRGDIKPKHYLKNIFISIVPYPIPALQAELGFQLYKFVASVSNNFQINYFVLFKTSKSASNNKA
jgi:hypothetical protein